jgi:hypothetical protein
MQRKSNPQILLGVWYNNSGSYIEKTRNRRRVRVSSSFISVLTNGIGVFDRRCLSAICVFGEVWQSRHSLRKTVYWSVRVGSSFISVLTTGIGVFGRRCLSAICVFGEVWQSRHSLRKTVYWSVRVGCDEVHDRVELIGD